MPLFLYYFVNNAVVLVGMLLLETLVGPGEPENGTLLIYLQTAVRMIGMFSGGMAVFPFYKKKSKEFSTSQVEYGTKEKLFTLAAGAVLGVGLNLLFYFGGFMNSSETYDKVAGVQFAVPLWLAVIFYGILSPIVEEMVFRGILYRELKQSIGRGGAMAGSAFLFGAFHGNIVQMVYGTIMGMILATCYEKYGEIEAPILFHSAANIAVYILSVSFHT